MSRAAWGVLVGGVLVGLLALPAAASEPQRVVRPADYFRLEVPAGWSAADLPAENAPLVGYRHDAHGLALAITRIRVPNPDAWRGKKPFFERIEGSTRRAVGDGYQRLSRKIHKLGAVPTMDLVFSRPTPAGREVVTQRLLFFRTFSLHLTIAVPADAYRAQKRTIQAVVASFVPHFED